MHEGEFELDDLQVELMALDGRRYHCSQILVSLGLRLQGRENPDLVRAAGGLAFGLGHSNETCGALLGGCCLLGLYGGKGHDGEEEAEWFRIANRRLAEWFRAAYGLEAGGELPSVRCTDLLDRYGLKHCGLMVRGTYLKAMELLGEFGADAPRGGPEP